MIDLNHLKQATISASAKQRNTAHTITIKPKSLMPCATFKLSSIIGFSYTCFACNTQSYPYPPA